MSSRLQTQMRFTLVAMALLGLAVTAQAGEALVLDSPDGNTQLETPSASAVRQAGRAQAGKPFSIRKHHGVEWLVNPAGTRFFSLGVCGVDQGTARQKYKPDHPGDAAWQHYSDSNRWAEATLNRLKSWGFTTIGGWSDFGALKQCRDAQVTFTPVLHVESTAGAPWWDMWDPKIIALVRDIIRKYDQRALILGDRYQSFYYPEVARASARFVDAVSSNLNAGWNDGSFARYYLETLRALTGRPVFVSEFYVAARENRSGNQNKPGFPVVDTQRERVAGFRRTLELLLRTPYVVGGDWFQ